jgi:hypothetical protein
MVQANPVGELTSAYLKKCGYSTATIDSWTSGTRLLHDIGLCGDDVLDDFKVLHDQFGVDLSGFEFKKYFPSELSTDALLLTLRPFLRAVGLQRLINRVYKRYPEVTLETIESVIKQKKWVAVS